METGGASTIQIILLILAAPVVLVLTAYAAVTLLRMQTQSAIDKIAEKIAGFDSRLEGMHHFLEEYSGIDQEPYISHLTSLQQEIGALQQEVEIFLDSSRSFEEEIAHSGLRSLQNIINAPFDWFRRWRRSNAMWSESLTLETQFSSTDDHIDQINELPWEIAEQCRAARKGVSELTRLAQALQNNGVRGDLLQAAAQQIPGLQRAIDSIPQVYFGTDQEIVLAGANEDDTIRVFGLLESVRPALAHWLPQVREWTAAYQKASGEFGELKQSGAALRQAIANPPAGLVVSGLQTRLDHIAQMASDIGQRLAQPEAEDLKALAREVVQLRKVIQDTGVHLDRSREQSGTLSQLIEELTSALEKLAGQFKELERAETHPLAWDRSGPLLSSLLTRLDALGPAQQPRTPEEIAQQLKEAREIRAGFQQVSAAYPKAAERYQALTSLLGSADILGGAAWLRSALEMLEHAEQYDPHNWPKQDAIHSLPGELEALGIKQGQAAPANRSSTIRESDLEQRLTEVRELETLHKALRPRVENVRARFQKIQAMEAEGKDLLTAAYTALERVALLTESNDMLYDITGKEIERLSAEMQQLGSEINTRAQGEVEKKLRKIHTLVDRVNRSLNTWLGRMNEAIIEQGKALNDRLVQIDSVGNLDEKPVVEAHNLLTREEYLSALRGASSPGSSPAGKLRSAVLPRTAQLGDLEATAEIKRKSDFWLTMLSTQKAVEEKTSTLISAYQEATAARSEAREALSSLTKRQPGKRSWPPNNQNAADESTLLKPVDERWEAMKNGLPRNIEVAILELGRLTQQYRLATERIQQILNRIEQDEERVKDLVEEIEELKRRWQNQGQADPNNLVMREGIQHLMGTADSRLSFIRQQYMRGAISYEETIHNLRLLNDELFASRVPVDEKNDIGLNEPPRRINA